MRISDILRTKGSEVFTIAEDASIGDAVAELARHGVGALVVSSDGRTPNGILSERDVVRYLAAEGDTDLGRSVGDLMTTVVRTCEPTATLDETLAEMTDKRFRHLPVVEDGALCGIVSIGDVVKLRLDELEHETDHLQTYISGR